MSRRRSTMSEQLKNELAKDLGFYDTVQREGWGSIKAKDAGNMVKRAIQMAEQAAAKQYQAQQAAQPQARPHTQMQAQPNTRAQMPTQSYQTSNYRGAHTNTAVSHTKPAGSPVASVPPYMQQAMAGAQQQSPVMYQ
ncbi:hypothetical protein JOC55_006364 [Paenibacillus sacheonensis]|nr:hypothetical protein [Paenibacillus sacheonensis]